MGTAWGMLLVLGFLIPTLVLVGSGWVVLRLARRAVAGDLTTRPPWQFVSLHVALALGAGVGADPLLTLTGLGFLAPLGVILGLAGLVAVPTYLFRRVHQGDASSRWMEPTRASLPAEPPRRRWGLAAFFVVTGVLLPWLTGLGVKLYLDSVGRPTYPVSDFTDPAVVPILLVMTLGGWAFPWVVLASALVVPWRVGVPAGATTREGMAPIWGAYVAGAVVTVPVFAAVFWEWDVMMLMVPVGVVLLPAMGLGYLVGWWVIRRRRAA